MDLLPSKNAAAGGGARNSPKYQIVLVALLSLNFGIVFFDRNSLNFLMPFVQPELHLTNTQIGNLASALSFTWAIAAFAMGGLSDALGKRKLPLVIATLLFSVCSFITGIAGTFGMLLAARLLMGVAEGGVMPISHALVAEEVDPKRRGLAQGIAQNFGSNLLGSFVAPVLLVLVAKAFGWRHAFYLAGLPGIFSAILLIWLIKEPVLEPKKARVKQEGPRYTMWDALKERNILLCVLLAILLVGYLVTCWAFMPLYLDQVLHVSKETNSWLMGTLGISATIGSFAVADLSDRIGRRPVMIAAPFISILLPLGALYFGGTVWMLFPIFFIGWCVNGIFPLFMATVPSETVDARHAATVLGLCMGAGEILGGAGGPTIAGMAADSFGLTAPLWIMVGLAAVSGVIAMGLRETAPSQIRAG
jgi:predicted MFS family arabinose efflux permease